MAALLAGVVVAAAVVAVLVGLGDRPLVAGLGVPAAAMVLPVVQQHPWDKARGATGANIQAEVPAAMGPMDLIILQEQAKAPLLYALLLLVVVIVIHIALAEAARRNAKNIIRKEAKRREKRRNEQDRILFYR